MKSSIKGIARCRYRIYPKRKPKWIQITKTFSNWYFPKKKGIVTTISSHRYYNVSDNYLYKKVCGEDWVYKLVIGSCYR